MRRSTGVVPGRLVSSESLFLTMDNVSSSISGSDDSDDSDFREEDDVGEVMVALLLVLPLARATTRAAVLNI